MQHNQQQEQQQDTNNSFGDGRQLFGIDNNNQKNNGNTYVFGTTLTTFNSQWSFGGGSGFGNSDNNSGGSFGSFDASGNCRWKIPATIW